MAIYFGSSATTRILLVVLRTYDKVSEDIWGSPSGLYKLGDRACQLLGASRKQIVGLLDVKPNEIFFTSYDSESNNLATKESAFTRKEFGRCVITTSVEHASVANTFTAFENMEYKVTRLPVNSEGRININDLRNSLDSDITLVSAMGANNEIGTIQPTIGTDELLENYPNIHLHVDSAQAFGENVWKQVFCLRADLMSLSARKYRALGGVDILYKRVGKMLSPLIDGGGQEKGLRLGTENLPAIVATARTVRLVSGEEAENYEREYAIREKVYSYLADKPGITVFSSLKSNFTPHVLTFLLLGIREEALVHTLEQKGIYVSTTSTCAPKVNDEISTLASMKVDEKVVTSSTRLSFGASNTLQEVDKFARVFDEIYRYFTKVDHSG